MATRTGPFDFLTDDTLSDEEIANVVQTAGFDGSRTHRGLPNDVVAIAVVLGESGGDPTAHNDNPATRDDSYGLFQINMHGDLKAERAARYGLDSTHNLFQPRKNAEIAYDLYRRRGYNFGDWSVYNNGSYLRYVRRAQKAAGNPASSIPTIGDAVGNAADAIPGLGQITALVEFVTDSNNWLRVGMFVGGGVLVIFGLIAAASTSKTGKSAIRAGTAVATRGASEIARGAKGGGNG